MAGRIMEPTRETSGNEASQVSEALATRRWEDVRALLSQRHPSDIADIIIELPADDEGIVFRLLSRNAAAEVFAYLPYDHQEGLIESLTREELSSILDTIPDDDRTRLFEELPAEVTRRLLRSLSPDDLKQARKLLGYPPNVAGRFMTPDYVAIKPGMSAREALDHVRLHGQGKETLDVVYVLGEAGTLLDDVRIGSLVLSDPDTKVAEIQDPALVSIPAMATEDEIVHIFEKYDRSVLPVTDDAGVMLGIITVDDVLDIAEREATEDIQKIGGMEALDAPYDEVGFLSMTRKRGGWLAALFLGEMLTATAMGHYEMEIEKAVVLALFVPLIISSGGNSGGQASSLIIRALALKELNLGDWWRVFRREVTTGITLGSFLGAIGFLRIVLWQKLHLADYGAHYMLVGFTVWVSLLGVVSFGTISGSMLPFLLRLLGFDPATSSAPFVATLVDVTGLVIYFTVASVILRGTLL